MISEEERKAIENIKEDIKYSYMRDTTDEDCTVSFIEDLETVLNLIEKQQKVANLQEKTMQLMAEEFLRLDSFMGDYDNHTIETLIEYFRNKAKEK